MAYSPSVYTRLQLSILNAVTLLDLRDTNNFVVPVDRRQLPRASEKLDSLPRIAIVPKDQPESVEIFDSENTVARTYGIQIVGIGEGNRKFVDMVGADNFFNWREFIALLYQGTPPSGVSEAWTCKFVPEVPLDNRQLNSSYLYTAMLVCPTTIEPRS